jgi:rubrerythrin
MGFARTLFQRMKQDDEAFRLFCSIAAAGEDQGGWENERIAALVQDPHLVPRIRRHGADERKHGRIFTRLLRNRGLEPLAVPPQLDYCMLLERRGTGLLHERLRADKPLGDEDVIRYLAHSRVTEQRASEQMRLLRRVYADDPELGRAMRQIAADEDNHLAYCHEELLRLAARGHGPRIHAELRATARAEIEVHHQVSLGVTRRIAELLRLPGPQRALLALGVHAQYAYDRAFGWRRMVTLRTPPPHLRDALQPEGNPAQGREVPQPPPGAGRCPQRDQPTTT